jgi:diacylglycerol kinase family enzyme
MRATVAAMPRRLWAGVALVALFVLAAVVLLQAVASVRTLAYMLVPAGSLLMVAPVAAWFAVTTRSAWKRAISVTVGLAVTGAAVASVVVFTLTEIGGLLVILVAALAFRAGAHRAVLVDRPTPAGRPRPAHPWLLVNPWSGGGTAARAGLVPAAEAAGFDVHVLAPGDDPIQLARIALAGGADVLAVAGGDGTLALVAGVAVEHDIPFLCVPAGTRNHFARDLGLDRSDPVGALQALDGREVRVDAAFVGDRLFLNNVSLGVYAHVVAEPDYRTSKLNTARVVLRRLVRGERDPGSMSVRNAEGRLFERVQLLQISNNRYQLRNLARLGARERLDAGLLQISALLTNKGSELAGLAARAATGRLRTAPAWAQWNSAALTVDSPLPLIAAGVDGESITLEPPLEFRVAPKALRVLVPAQVPPWAQARRRQQAIPALWRLATGRDRLRTGAPATVAPCPPRSAT